MRRSTRLAHERLARQDATMPREEAKPQASVQTPSSFRSLPEAYQMLGAANGHLVPLFLLRLVMGGMRWQQDVAIARRSDEYYLTEQEGTFSLDERAGWYDVYAYISMRQDV